MKSSAGDIAGLVGAMRNFGERDYEAEDRKTEALAADYHGAYKAGYEPDRNASDYNSVADIMGKASWQQEKMNEINLRTADAQERVARLNVEAKEEIREINNALAMFENGNAEGGYHYGLKVYGDRFGDGWTPVGEDLIDGRRMIRFEGPDGQEEHMPAPSMEQMKETLLQFRDPKAYMGAKIANDLKVQQFNIDAAVKNRKMFVNDSGDLLYEFTFADQKTGKYKRTYVNPHSNEVADKLPKGYTPASMKGNKGLTQGQTANLRAKAIRQADKDIEDYEFRTGKRLTPEQRQKVRTEKMGDYMRMWAGGSGGAQAQPGPQAGMGLAGAQSGDGRRYITQNEDGSHTSHNAADGSVHKQIHNVNSGDKMKAMDALVNKIAEEFNRGNDLKDVPELNKAVVDFLEQNPEMEPQFIDKLNRLKLGEKKAYVPHSKYQTRNKGDNLIRKGLAAASEGIDDYKRRLQNPNKKNEPAYMRKSGSLFGG
jgi:hypothetical protein